MSVLPPLVCIVGCPRSGTTWLQLLLAQHPAVETTQETHLFSNYLGRLYTEWSRETSAKSPTGLTTLVDESAFHEALRKMADGILAHALPPGSHPVILVEKTPHHIHAARLIHTLYPDVSFLNIVRDPRAVVASLLAASSDWGRSWAPAGSVGAAEQWRRSVRAGDEIARVTERNRTVRYEDLSARPVEELEGVLTWLGLPFERHETEEWVARCSADRMRRAPHGVRTPPNMKASVRTTLRRGTVDSWKTELSRSQIATVEYLARREMPRFGYEPVVNRGQRPTLRAVASEVIRRANTGVSTLGSRVTRRL